jgi:hypothetical protein
MISPKEKSFIFIHRYYHNRQRFVRLMFSDYNSLKVLLDFGMVSHYCWIDNINLLGFVQVKDK